MRFFQLGRAGALLGVCGSAAAADATFLERLEAFDVNDYALGVVVSRSDNVYIGASDSVAIYPILSHFYPSDFDDGILFGRDGGLGVRWAPPFGFEAGVLARVQGLGFVAEDSDALGCMPDRDWTVEAGPTIGWRRWPVEVDWMGYVDLLRRHEGGNQYLRFSLPVRSDRGYLVPEIGIRRYSPRFVDYYYGVPAAFATPDRPAYEGTAASNPSFAIDWGLRIKRNWLISGRVGMEWLDSSITDSPIVGDDQRAFASLRLSYDEPVFASLDAPAVESAPRRPFARVQLPSASLDVNTSLALLAWNDSTVDSSSGDGDLVYVDVLLHVTPRHQDRVSRLPDGSEYRAGRQQAAQVRRRSPAEAEAALALRPDDGKGAVLRSRQLFVGV